MTSSGISVAKKPPTKQTEEEEEECALVKRYYREIDEVTTLVDNGMDNDGVVEGKEQIARNDSSNGERGENNANEGNSNNVSSILQVGMTTVILQNTSDNILTASMDESATSLSEHFINNKKELMALG
eukprot:5797041-Ditylum_brightwellii.AAC.1